MMGAKRWRAKAQKVNAVHVWRPRRSCRGELVQWDTSEHDWLEGRGEKMYLIHMIDDATSELTAFGGQLCYRDGRKSERPPYRGPLVLQNGNFYFATVVGPPFVQGQY